MNEEQTEERFTLYEPSQEDKDSIKKVYNAFQIMRDVSTKPYHYFNDRTLKQFVDDSERRFNSYVPSKKNQGKEEWQSNFFHPVTRNKTMAILASVALDIPKMRVTARNEKNEVNMKIAGVTYDLVKGSYDNEDKEENAFFEALSAAVKGTVITAEAYLKTKVKRKFIKSYDVITGAIEVEEKDITIDEGCSDFIVPLENFFVRSAFIRNIQKQPDCIWVQYMEEEDFEYEFSQYKNFKFVPKLGELVGDDIQERFFFEAWNTRTTKQPYEVVRYYNKPEDEHVVIINGVRMYNGPLLLGRKKKYYPFSKSGYAPFSEDFFWMNSLPNSLMGEQDIINSFYNMATDKTRKGLVPQLLVGNVNKDDFDLDDENVSLDTKIYVQDINQVKELPYSGLSQSDIKMIDMIGRGLDLSSVDANQQGVAGRGVTAREVVIANENARKLKGIFFMFISSLWFQKTKLRTLNVLTYYTMKQVSGIVGDKKSKDYRKFIVDNTELSDGSRGSKGIIIAQGKENLPNQSEIDQNVSEYKAVNKDSNYEEIAVTAEYINDWEYVFKIIPESIYQNDSSYSISKNEDKLKLIGTLFPKYFQLNQEKLFKDTLESYDEDIDEYDLEEKAPQATPGAVNPQDGNIPGQPGQTPPSVPGAPGALPPMDMAGAPSTMQ